MEHVATTQSADLLQHPHTLHVRIRIRTPEHFVCHMSTPQQMCVEWVMWSRHFLQLTHCILGAGATDATPEDPGVHRNLIKTPGHSIESH